MEVEEYLEESPIYGRDFVMILDRNALNKLLLLNDGQLKMVMERLAAESGLDLSALNISTDDISSVRSALSGASDRDLERVAQQLTKRKNGEGGH